MQDNANWGCYWKCAVCGDTYGGSSATLFISYLGTPKVYHVEFQMSTYGNPQAQLDWIYRHMYQDGEDDLYVYRHGYGVFPKDRAKILLFKEQAGPAAPQSVLGAREYV